MLGKQSLASNETVISVQFDDKQHKNVKLYGTTSKPTKQILPANLLELETDQHLLNQLFAEYLLHVPSAYNHRIFRKAGKLFDSVKSPSRGDELKSQSQRNIKLKFYNEEERRKTLELAHAALPYQAVMENILDEIRFYRDFPKWEKESGTVMVMLYDFLQRHFQPLLFGPTETLESIRKIEAALLSRRTAINAALARQRIEHNVCTVEQLLPDKIRQLTDMLPSLPQYSWINNLKTNMSALVEQLQKEGLSLAKNRDYLIPTGFCRDVDCMDLLIFHPSCRNTLHNLPLVEMNHLVIQRKSSCLAAYITASVFHNMHHERSIEIEKYPLVLLTNLDQGFTAAHLASLLGTQTQIIACCPTNMDTKLIEQRLNQFGAYNIKIFHQNFCESNPQEIIFSQIQVILANPNSTNSGICDPVDFILRESGDIQLLRDTYNLQNDANLPELTSQQAELLRHALHFPSVRTVIYYTHSVHEAENENIVEKVIEEVNIQHQNLQLAQKIGKKFIQTEEPPHELFKTEPIPIMCEDSCTLNSESMLFLKTQPSVWLEGFFMAVIKRQGDAKVPAKEVINQARAKGLLDMKGKMQSHQTPHSSIRESLSCSCADQNVCEKCKSRGVFNTSPVQQNSHSTYKSKHPSSYSRVQSSPDSHTLPAQGNNKENPSPPSPVSQNQTRFPVLKRKEHAKRLLYPLATKTLHLPGIGPGICYPPCFSPSSSEVDSKPII